MSDSSSDLSVPRIVWSGPWTVSNDSEDKTSIRIVIVNITDVIVEIQDVDAMDQPRWEETDNRETIIWALKKLAVLVT